jgi:hypothetical protein
MQLEGSNRDLTLGIDRNTTIADISTSICFKMLDLHSPDLFCQNERLDEIIKMVAFNSNLNHLLVRCTVLLKVIPIHLMLCYATLSGRSTCPMTIVNSTLLYIKQSISYIIKIDINDLVLFLSSTIAQINDTLDL